MSKRLLVIDRDDQGRFLLDVHGGTLTIGASAAEADFVLRHLHVTRLHCEVEVDEDLVVADNRELGGAPQELKLGAALHYGLTHLRFQAADSAALAQVAGSAADDLPDLALDDGAIAAPSELQAPGPDNTVARRQFRFRVVDGADKGRLYALPERGVVTVGKSHKHADIVLNDLYVSRVHCELRVEPGYLVARHLEGEHGTLVDGQKVQEKDLYLGAVLRVGNSHLKLECFEEPNAPAPGKSVAEKLEASRSTGENAEESGFEVVEEEIEAVAAEPDGEQAGTGSESFMLPHSPVDKLLELEGQTFGHFKIESLLGRGQSGLVFRAQDQKSKQTVALKVLAADFPASDAELSRFVSALKTASSLHHPSLVTVHSAGKCGAYCWLSREYIEGESLTRRIRRLQEGGKPDWKAACRLALHLTSLLDFLHRHKVAHGNITPRNVLIRASDQMTKLADLMLNRALEGSKLQHATLGKKLLTELPYTAPEQTDPNVAATPLGDIYSVGVVLYAVLTGKPPFTGETPKAVLSQIRAAKVVPPTKLQRGIPALFETNVLMMMAHRPEERFQSAAEMLAAIESFAEKHDIEA